MPDIFLLTDRASVKTIMGIGGADRDAEIDLQIRAVSGAIANFCGRRDAMESKSRSYTFHVRPSQRVWQLPAYPVASITDVRLDYDRAFGSGTILDTQLYSVDTETGVVSFDLVLEPAGGRKWANTLQINCVAGMADSLTALRSGYADIEQACQYQVQHNLKRKETDPGKFTTSTGGASRTTPALDLLPYVKTLLAPHITERLA